MKTSEILERLPAPMGFQGRSWLLVCPCCERKGTAYVEIVGSEAVVTNVCGCNPDDILKAVELHEDDLVGVTIDTPELVPAPGTSSKDDVRDSDSGDLVPSWNPVDITDVLDEDPDAGPWPEILTRDGKAGLFYPGHSHMLYGESESGKSWAALCAAAEVLAANECVLYIDFESDARTIVGRMQALGALREALVERFTYLRPDERLVVPESLPGYRLAVIDGMTDAYMVYGLDQNVGKDVSALMRELVRPVLERSGAAVVLVDHVVKSNDNRGRFPQGSQNKLSTITGAAYLVEPKEVLGAGLRGEMSLRVTKDRPGRVRATAGPYRKSDRTQEAARLELDSTGEGTTYKVLAPEGIDAETGEKTAFRFTFFEEKITEYLTNYPGATSTAIVDSITGNRTRKLAALNQMVTDGLVRVEAKPGKGGGKLHYLSPQDGPAGVDPDEPWDPAVGIFPAS